jgi:hypothetical protein
MVTILDSLLKILYKNKQKEHKQKQKQCAGVAQPTVRMIRIYTRTDYIMGYMTQTG